MKIKLKVGLTFLFGTVLILPLISRFFMDYEGENEYIFATAAVTFLLALILPGVVAFIFGSVLKSKTKSFFVGLIPYLAFIIILCSDFSYRYLLNYLLLGILSGLIGIAGCLKIPTERKLLKFSFKLLLFCLLISILVMSVFSLLTNETRYANVEYIGTYPLIPGFKGIVVVENYPKAYGGFADHIPRRMVFMNVKDDGTIILEEAKVGNPISLLLGVPLNPRNARFSSEIDLNPGESVSKGDVDIRYYGSDEIISLSEVKPFIKLNLNSEGHYGVLIHSDETSLHLYRVFEEDGSISLYIYKNPYPNKIYFARPAYHLIRIEKDKMSELNETIGNYLEYVDHEDEDYLYFKIPSGALKRDDELILLKNPYIRENMDFVHEAYVSVRIEEKLVKNLRDIPVEYVNYEDNGYIHFSIPRELGSSDFLTYASPCEIVLEEPILLSVEGSYRLVDLCYIKNSNTLIYAPKCEGDKFKHGVVGPTAGRNPGSYHPATMTKKIVIGDEGDFLQDE